MKERYFISKKEYNGDVVYLNCKRVKGYKFTPKNNVPYDGISVNEMVIIKPSMIEKIIKRKIKNHLDMFLKVLIDIDDSDDDARRALDDVQRYKNFVNEKYSPFLDEKYMNLLMKKMNVIERELKQSVVYASLLEDDVKENSRRR